MWKCLQNRERKVRKYIEAISDWFKLCRPPKHVLQWHMIHQKSILHKSGCSRNLAFLQSGRYIFQMPFPHPNESLKISWTWMTDNPSQKLCCPIYWNPALSQSGRYSRLVQVSGEGLWEIYKSWNRHYLFSLNILENHYQTKKNLLDFKGSFLSFWERLSQFLKYSVFEKHEKEILTK